jgi:hypothetical protein
MLRLLFFLLMTVSLFSCSSTTPSGKLAADSTAGAMKADTPKGQPVARHPVESEDTVLPFAGVWVNEVYLDSIRYNRSPRLSQGVEESCIILPARTLQVTSMIAGFHDGGPAWVVVKSGSHYQFYYEARELPGDTIESLSLQRLRIGHHYFGRLNQPDIRKSDFGILEELLFTGTYLTDKGEKVIFGPNGSVTGLPGLAYYEPVVDYADRGDRQVDLLQLGPTRHKMDNFGFLFRKDTLTIYMVNCLRYDRTNGDCDSNALGEMLFSLVKQ